MSPLHIPLLAYPISNVMRTCPGFYPQDLNYAEFFAGEGNLYREINIGGYKSVATDIVYAESFQQLLSKSNTNPFDIMSTSGLAYLGLPFFFGVLEPLFGCVCVCGWERILAGVPWDMVGHHLYNHICKFNLRHIQNQISIGGFFISSILGSMMIPNIVYVMWCRFLSMLPVPFLERVIVQCNTI